jgi:high-affinity Fe2+/Pb2+ permease
MVDEPRAWAPALLGLLAAVFVLAAFILFAGSKSAIHELQGFAALLIAAILLVGAVISHGLHLIRRQSWEQEEAREEERSLADGPRRRI